MASKKAKVKIDSRLVDLFVDTWNEMTGDDLDRKRINWGWCYQFAIVIKKIYGGELITATPAHAWVRIDGRDYDSDNIRGTTEMVRGTWFCDEVKSVNLTQLRAEWAGIGNSGPVRMDVINETVKRWKAQEKSA